MKGLANAILSFCNLMEAEGRVLKANVKTVGLGCGLVSLGLLFVGIALILGISALYAALDSLLPTPLVLLIMAGVSAIIAWIILSLAKKYERKQS